MPFFDSLRRVEPLPLPITGSVGIDTAQLNVNTGSGGGSVTVPQPLQVWTEGAVGVSGSATAPVWVTTTGSLAVKSDPNSLIDTGNSSTTPLGGNVTFTGTPLDVSSWQASTIFIYADAPGSLNLQWSTDNSHWDNSVSYAIVSGTAEHVQQGPQAQYFRVQYVNGATPQGVFRLQTIHRDAVPYAPVIPVSSTPDPSADAILVKSVITGKTTGGGGGYVDVKVSPAGAVQVGGILDSITAPVQVWNEGQVGVSGSVTSIIGNWPSTIGVSASAQLPVFNTGPVGVTASAALQVWSAGTIGVSGSLTTTPFFSNTPQGVTGSVNVYTSGLQGVSGTVQVWSEGPIEVSGSIKSLYGSNHQAITISFANLGNNNARASAAIDNTSNLFQEAFVRVFCTTPTSGTSTTGYLNVYAAGSNDGGVSYDDGATGSDAAITLTNPPNMRLIGVINCVANNTAYTGSLMPVSPAFGYTMPDHWLIVIENKTGTTLTFESTKNKAYYQGVNRQMT